MSKHINQKNLVAHNFNTREYGSEHHRLDDETIYGRLLQDGNAEAINKMQVALASSKEGILSSDSLTDKKYFFVSAVTITVRFCISGGMDEQEAYYTSDLFIRALDSCHSIKDVLNLTHEMTAYFVNKMASIRDFSNCSKPVHDCIGYIDEHLHEQLSASELAEHVGFHADYLCKLFKQEIGVTLSAFVKRKKLDAACQMLMHSNYSCSDISFYLGYSSQSYFIKVFRDYFGVTPLNYRKHAYQLPFSKAEPAALQSNTPQNG